MEVHAKVPYLSLEEEKENVCVVFHADVLRGSSRLPAPRTRDEPLRTSAWEANVGAVFNNSIELEREIFKSYVGRKRA